MIDKSGNKGPRVQVLLIGKFKESVDVIGNRVVQTAKIFLIPEGRVER
jgi:hypothetical protein